MNRLDLLQLVVGRARANGFELRRWYTHRLEVPWISSEAALALLNTQRRYYALIFSHDFAQCFWKPGSEISFDVPEQTFQRTMRDGSVRTVTRKAFIRRSLRSNAWKYHLREMALADDPLRYLRRYLHIEEEPKAGAQTYAADGAAPSVAPVKSPPLPRRIVRPLPAELPAFLRKPYVPPAPAKAVPRS